VARRQARLSRREYALRLRCDTYGVSYAKVSRAAVFRRDRWICQLCGEPVDRLKRYPNPASASIDHRVPLSKGGGHNFANAQLAHLHCNKCKGAKFQLPREVGT
jgi:5-methylcytosine-specific restriction endonuclease McrA